MNCLFDPARVVIRVTINKLYFVPEWLVSGVVGILWNGESWKLSHTGFLVNVAWCTSERLEDLCKTELRSTIETFDSPVLRLHPNNINRDSGIEIPEAWMPTIKKHNNRRAVRQRTAEGANHWVNSKDRNAPIRAVEKTTNHSRASCFIRSHMTSQPYRQKKTSSIQSKRRDLHHTWLHRETNEKPSFHPAIFYSYFVS